MKKIIQLTQKVVEPAADTINDDQNAIINEIFLGCETDAHAQPEQPQHKQYRQRIAKKILGYKSQDVANQIFDPRWFIGMQDVMELLVVSKLKCHYCSTNCAIAYSKPLFDSQWTLDRICNDQGHNRGNVVISCLKCNLNRGMKSSYKYKLGKQLKFIKLNATSIIENNII